MKFEIVIAGTVIGTYSDREDAEKRLNEVRNSYLALVHPLKCMYIREVTK